MAHHWQGSTPHVQWHNNANHAVSVITCDTHLCRHINFQKTRFSAFIMCILFLFVRRYPRASQSIYHSSTSLGPEQCRPLRHWPSNDWTVPIPTTGASRCHPWPLYNAKAQISTWEWGGQILRAIEIEAKFLWGIFTIHEFDVVVNGCGGDI